MIIYATTPYRKYIAPSLALSCSTFPTTPAIPTALEIKPANSVASPDTRLADQDAPLEIALDANRCCCRLNAVKPKFDYLYRLKLAIEDLFKCPACYLRTQWVDETVEIVRETTVWVGDVEVFVLIGHPKANICYAWNHREGKKDQAERFVAVLEIPPVDSPQTAVRDSVVSDSKKSR
jgi:hypothetical protein